MDLARIKELLAIVAESGVAEVEIEEDDFKLVVRRHAASVTVQPAGGYPPFGAGYPPMYAPPPPAYAPPPAAAPPPAPAPAAPAPTPSEDAAPAPAANEVVVRAPIVGTFYEAPAPGADPFVQVGSAVKPGDVLCIIEAMKLMNEIESEVAGVVARIEVPNGEPVEYDQPLFVIETA